MIAETLAYLVFGSLFFYCIRFILYGVALLQPSIIDVNIGAAQLMNVTVIIPFRNELKNLKAILADLQKQNYSADLTEVIFVDDHSTDGSGEYITAACSKLQGFTVLIMNEGFAGKKHAIDYGIMQAKGGWIIQTDADCRVKEGFIASHVMKATKSRFDLLAGPVRLNSEGGVWNKLEALEFLSLTGTGMASFLSGKPVMCSGANLSCSKEFYMEIREELLNKPTPSGDDIFLLTEAKKRGKHTGFIYNRDAIVTTAPSGGISAFISQRIRWGSKSRYYKDRDLIQVTLLVGVTNGLMTLFLAAALIDFSYFTLFLLALGLKSVADFILVAPAANFFGQRRLLWLFLPTVFIYYFYITVTGILSLIGKFQWKGRTF